MLRAMTSHQPGIARTSLSSEEVYAAAQELQAAYELFRDVAQGGKLPVVLFTIGGIANPADAAMMMQLGAEGVFIGSGIFKSGNPAERAAASRAVKVGDEPVPVGLGAPEQWV